MAIFETIPAGDLAVDANGTPAFVGGQDFIRQKLSSRFRFFLGEWFLDQRQGIPYFRDVLVKNPDLRIIRILLRRVLVTCPGVLSVATFDVQFDPVARALSFDFAVIVDGGTVVVTPNDRDFIVAA